MPGVLVLNYSLHKYRLVHTTFYQDVNSASENIDLKPIYMEIEILLPSIHIKCFYEEIFTLEELFFTP